jgi:hypothetical protein
MILVIQTMRKLDHELEHHRQEKNDDVSLIRCVHRSSTAQNIKASSSILCTSQVPVNSICSSVHCYTIWRAVNDIARRPSVHDSTDPNHGRQARSRTRNNITKIKKDDILSNQGGMHPYTYLVQGLHVGVVEAVVWAGIIEVASCHF